MKALGALLSEATNIRIDPTMDDDEDNSIGGETVSTLRRIQKQLARDIEENGGIAHFAGHNQRLAQLLDRKSDDEGHTRYGERADPIRKKLQKKVYSWIVLDREDKYIGQVLNPWRIRQWSARNTSKTKTRSSSKRQAAAAAAAVSDDISVASSSSSAAASSLSDSSNQATVPAKKPASKKKSTPVNQVILRGRRPQKKEEPKTNPPMSASPLAKSFKKMSIQSPPIHASPAANRPKRKSRWDTIAEQASKFL